MGKSIETEPRTPSIEGGGSVIAAAIPHVDLAQARRFLQILDSEGVFTFQTFDDRKGAKPRMELATVLHGRFDEHAEQLARLNNQGAGVFVMVNRGDGQIRSGQKSCRTNANVVAIRALFLDLDGAPLAPVLQAGPPPSIIVESSSGRWHVYWTVTGCPIAAFKERQKVLADRFNGDTSVNDLARVMRLPGYQHRKGQPFMSRLVSEMELEATK